MRYEKTLLKEPVIARFLTAREGADPRPAETVLQEIIEDALAKKTGDSIASTVLPNIIFFDQSCELIPYLWICQEWVDGSLIDQNELPDAYQRLGATVARLHNTTFNSFRDSFLSDWQPASKWTDGALTQISAISEAFDLGVDAARLQHFATPQKLTLVLAHNDLQPLNIIATEKDIRILDWDNAQIAPRELDLVKLKYWTRRNNSGILDTDSALYDKFISEYNICFVKEVDQSALYLCELLWLCRIYNFESDREANGRLHSPFKSAAAYRHLINELYKKGPYQ